MTSVLVLVAPAALAGCLLAGIWPDRGLSLMRCWWKVRYATTWTDAVVGITGWISATALYVIIGMARLIILFGGVIGILSTAVAERNGGWLPTYRTYETKMREIKEDG